MSMQTAANLNNNFWFYYFSQGFYFSVGYFTLPKLHIGRVAERISNMTGRVIGNAAA